MRLNQSTRHWSKSLLMAVSLSMLLCGLPCGLLCTPARGQTTTASIRGTVYDEAGPVISGATLTAPNETTGLTRFAISDASGVYLIPKLQVGSYTLAVEKAGFRRLSMTGITLQVDQIAEIDPKLNVGNISDSISITSEATLVNTTTAAVGEVIDNKRIVDLPLNGRQFLQLATLTSGVTV